MYRERRLMFFFYRLWDTDVVLHGCKLMFLCQYDSLAFILSPASPHSQSPFLVLLAPRVFLLLILDFCRAAPVIF